MEFGPDKIPAWRRKNTDFAQKWDFEDRFRLKATHAHEFFVRYRKCGLRGSRNYEKMFVQV